MGKIRKLFGLQEEEPMEQPRSPWTATEPDDDTRTTRSPWAGRPREDTPPMRDTQDVPDPDVQQRSFAEAAGRLPDPVTDSGVHYTNTLPGLHPEGAGSAQDDSAGERCAVCGGRIPSDHELLMEILTWLAPDGEDFVHQFYIDLFEAAPDLRPLFPDDIKIQEEKLLTAIVSLLRLFKAGEQEMDQLNSALARYGRSHTRFDPAATIEEYAAVWTVLAGVAARMLGEKLTDRHVRALRRAFEYGAGMMLASQATAKLAGVGRRRRTV